MSTAFVSSSQSTSLSANQLSVGIDIGTTTICAVVIDIDKHTQVDFFNVPNKSDLKHEDAAFCEQDANLIYEKVSKLLEQIFEKHTGIKSIGVTGQMHGILYLDKTGNALSPLITWKDKRADSIYNQTGTYCDYIYELTGEQISTGYGFATHFYNVQNDLVPENAYSFCSIMDYIVLRLTDGKFPITHTSIAAGFGMFDIKQGSFKADKISLLGIDKVKPPEVTADYMSCGCFKGACVSVAIGDNQASFLGSVKDLNNSILVNIGTGSQISAVADSCDNIDDTGALEIRPLVKNRYIVCGSALCGGASYALLERFFREYASFAGMSDMSQYELINKLAQETYLQGKTPLTVNTCFSGKRNEPDCTGSILNITYENFTPGQLALGFIVGMCNELHDMFGTNADNKTIVVASGNAVQRIPIMKNILNDIFTLPIHVSLSKEEASIGTALFSAVSANLLRDIEAFADFIAY